MLFAAFELKTDGKIKTEKPKLGLKSMFKGFIFARRCCVGEGVL